MISNKMSDIHLWKQLIPQHFNNGLKKKITNNNFLCDWILTNNVSFLNWSKIKFYLSRQINFIQKSLKAGSYILVVTDNPQLNLFVKILAKNFGIPFITGPWKGGMIPRLCANKGLPTHVIVLTLNFPTNFVNEIILLGIPTTFLLNTFPKRQGMFSLLPFTNNNLCIYYLIASTIIYATQGRVKDLTKSLYFDSNIKKHPSVVKELNIAPIREFLFKNCIKYKVPVRDRMNKWFKGLLKTPNIEHTSKQITRKNLLFRCDEKIRISSWRGKNYLNHFAPKKFVIKQKLAKERTSFGFHSNK